MSSHTDPHHALHHHGARACGLALVSSLCVLKYANCSRHTAEEVELWKKITAVGSLMVAGVFLNWLASDHHHMHTPPAYPYLRIRNKPLPWGDGTKDLLDARDTYVDDHDHHGHH